MDKVKLLVCKVNSKHNPANIATEIIRKGIIVALDTIFSHRRMAQESHSLTEDDMEGKELTTTEEKCSLKGDVTLNVDGSILKKFQTCAVAFLARDKDWKSLYCGMAWPIQQDSHLVEAIGVCISIQTALKESAEVDKIIVQTDHKNFLDVILKEKKRRETDDVDLPINKPIDNLTNWVLNKLKDHKNLEVAYVPRIQNTAADELSNLARTLTHVVTAKKVTMEHKPLWDDQKIIDDGMGQWIHTYVYWRDKIPDAFKGTLLEDLLLVRVGLKQGKKRKFIKVMIAVIDEAQLREDIHQTKQLVAGLVQQINQGSVKIFVLRCKSEDTIEEITFTVYPPDEDNGSYNDNVKEELKLLAYRLQHYGNVVPPPSPQNGVLVDMLAKYEKLVLPEQNGEQNEEIEVPADLTIVEPHYLEVGGERWDSDILPGQWMDLGCYNLANINLGLKITTRRAPPKGEETTYLKRIKGIKEMEVFSLPPGKEEVV
ncbi:hypothetical protein FH972_027135 [Carpinus fangiana]|uniref:RNase H type-1 domain-containing protein n=1 Tax=Carpinus fangiana TaxID=176857 RepID=A0A5N6L6D2_9ROSI|nr:hypothetical protein FH972_027135 [Carpinus fangiana]